MNTCKQCGRPIHGDYYHKELAHGEPVRGTVYHEMYGCESGCCGHVVELFDAEGRAVCRRFEFTHPYGVNPQEWAQTLLNDIAGRSIEIFDARVYDD